MVVLRVMPVSKELVVFKELVVLRVTKANKANTVLLAHKVMLESRE